MLAKSSATLTQPMGLVQNAENWVTCVLFDGGRSIGTNKTEEVSLEVLIHF